ncbi:MAG: fatty acid desaturase family protein [Pseudomonadota bacterium]
MNDHPSTPAAPAVPEKALADIRRTLHAALGSDTIAGLHARRPALDLLALAAAPALFLGNVQLLATLEFGALWLLAFVLQGFLLQLMGLVSHDLLVHRQVLGNRGSWLMSIPLTLPRLSLATGYERAHLAHHRWIGSARDTEAYKQHLNTRRRRLLFATLLGVKLAQAGKLKSNDGLRAYHDVSGQGDVYERRARIERRLLRGFLLAMLALALLLPEQVLYGWLLPTLVMGPVVNTLRIVIEHADADPQNPWNWSTWYRTGPLSRALFFWDSGDCHVVHHVFPRLPWYHMGRAVDLMRPVFLAHGVIERTSYPALLKGWFIDVLPHRWPWPLPRPRTARVIRPS